MAKENTIRIDVLHQSLEFEFRLSYVLGHLFKVRGDSKVFGDTSSALSYQAKVDLLRDINRITPEDYNYLLLFAEIRNKLIHNIEIDTLEKTLAKINRKKIFFSIDETFCKYYNEETNDETKESHLKFIYNKLVLIISGIFIKILKQVSIDVENERIAMEALVGNKSKGILIDSLFAATNHLFEEIKKLIPDKAKALEVAFLDKVKDDVDRIFQEPKN